MPGHGSKLSLGTPIDAGDNITHSFLMFSRRTVDPRTARVCQLHSCAVPWGHKSSQLGSRRQEVTNQRGAKRGKAAQAQTEALQLSTLMLTAALTQEQRLLQNVPNVAASPTPQHAFLLGPPPRR